MKKKLLSTITILCMLCAFLPTFVSAENQMLEEGIIVKADGVYIGTSEAAATPEELALYGISFTAGSPAKLTLNNTTILTETGVDASTQISNKTVNSAIYLATAANIELIGKNVAANESSADKYICAVYAPNNLTVTGTDGKLEADTRNANSSAGASVYCGGAFVNSSSIELQRASKTYGLYAKTSLENSGELKAEGSNNSTYGVYADGALTNNGTITGAGKNYGVYSKGQMTNNGTMTADNSATNNGAVHSSNNITNTGTMNASSSAGYAVCTSFTFYNKGSESICNADSNSSAISALAVNNEGTLKAGSQGGTKANSYGIKINSGGSVTNSGTLEARGCIGGVYIPSGTFTNNAGGKVFCEAGLGTSVYALYCNGKITNGGELEVCITNGGTNAYGIYTAGTTLENKAGAKINAHIDEYILDGTNRWAVTTKTGAIYVVNVGINNSGKITATTPNTAVTNYAVYATSTITNNAGGEIYATSGGSKGSSSICGAVHSNSSYIVNSGTIQATAVGSDYITRGIYAKTQLVNSGVIEASAGEGSGNSMGIFVGNGSSANVSLQNNEGGKITASAEQYGVFVASGFLYNDGEFTATAPTLAYVNNAGGLYLPNVGDKITAHGDTLFNGGYGDYYTVSGSNTEMMAKSLTCVTDPIVIENKKYTVSFNTDGAGEVSSQSTSAYVEEPTGLSKKGYVFDGWYYGAGLNNKFDFSSNYVRSDFVLTAKWIPDSIALTVDKDKNYTVDITTASLEGTIFVALYDGDKLVKVNEHPLSDSAKILGSFTEEGTKVKAFWWDSLENMKPKALPDVKDIPAE